MYMLKKSIRLHQVVMMIKDCKILIDLQHIHMDTSNEKVCKTKLLMWLEYKNG